MNIAVWHNLPSGGGKRALWHHLSGLIKRGHTVESWCPSTATQEFLPLSDLCRENVLPFRRHGRRHGAMDLKRLLGEMDAHCRECARQMQEKKFDILFANSCFLFATSPIGRYLQVPKALYLGEPWREFYEALPKLLWLTTPQAGKGLRRLGWARSLADWYRLRAMRFQANSEIANAEAFDEILVNSLFSRESVVRAYGLDAHVCYLGIDTEKFRSTGEPRENYVIGLGALNYHKGLDRAVKAIAAVPKTIRPALLWVGNQRNPGYVQSLHDLAASTGVDFTTKDNVTDKELVSLLSRARALLYMSRLEPFGLAPLEANACGLPVVAVAEGGVRESIEDGRNGILTSDAEPEKVASALVTILKNPALAAEMAANSRQLVVSKWSLEAGVDRLENILLRRVNAAHRPNP